MTVSQVIEIAPTIIMASVFEQPGLQIIRRQNQRKQPIQSEEYDLLNCSDLMRLPEYHYEHFPYVVARSKSHLCLVNVR